MLMTTHAISALLAGKYLGHTEAIMLGSLLIDFDHVYDIIRHWRKYGLRKAFEVLFIAEPEENEQRTVFHSIVGMLFVTTIFYLIEPDFGLYFGIGYLIHLILDSLDTSKLHLFYPNQYDVRGLIEYNSMMEYLLAIGMFIIYLFF